MTSVEKPSVSRSREGDDVTEIKKDNVKIYDELTRRFGEDFIPAFNNNFSQASLFTEDSIFLPHGHGVIHGRTAVDARNQATKAARVSKCTDWRVIDIGVLSTDYAYTIMLMKIAVDNGKTLNVRSFSVWQKVDGVWLICRDQFNYLPVEEA